MTLRPDEPATGSSLGPGRLLLHPATRRESPLRAWPPPPDRPRRSVGAAPEGICRRGPRTAAAHPLAGRAAAGRARPPEADQLWLRIV